jgi:hypothetical protein
MRPCKINSAMGSIRFACALVVLAVSAPALAEEPTAPGSHLGVPDSISELPAALRVPASMLAEFEAKPTEATPKRQTKNSSSCNENGCGYKAILGNLVITRDIQASTNVSLRVLPTAHALGGRDAATPFLLRPRVNGSGSYGLDFRAKF